MADLGEGTGNPAQSSPFSFFLSKTEAFLFTKRSKLNIGSGGPHLPEGLNPQLERVEGQLQPQPF